MDVSRISRTPTFKYEKIDYTCGLYASKYGSYKVAICHALRPVPFLPYKYM
jgi:hypothetical protein